MQVEIGACVVDFSARGRGSLPGAASLQPGPVLSALPRNREHIRFVCGNVNATKFIPSGVPACDDTATD